jgi:hypothetical protein
MSILSKALREEVIMAVLLFLIRCDIAENTDTVSLASSFLAEVANLSEIEDMDIESERGDMSDG